MAKNPSPFIINSSVVCLPDGTLLDGFTRYEILGELGIPITEDMIEYRDLPLDKLQEEVFDLDIARRHLESTDKLRWITNYLPEVKERGKQKMSDSGKAGGKKAGVGRPVQPTEQKGFTDVGKPLSDQISDNTEGEQTQAPVDTGKELAKMAGVGKTQVTEYKWCQKYIPDLLEAGEAMGEATHTIWKRGQVMRKLIAKHGMWEDVKNKELIPGVLACLAAPLTPVCPSSSLT